MGLIQAAKDTISGMLADQWREYFYCDAMPNEVLVTKGKIRVTGKNGNKGVDNIITNGSIIAVNEGQCMIIVDQGRLWSSVQMQESSCMTPPLSPACYTAT